MQHPEDGSRLPERDDGLRRLLTWTFVALVAALLMAFLGVHLAIQWFDTAS